MATSAQAATLGQIGFSMEVEGQPSWAWTSDADGHFNEATNRFDVYNGNYTYGPGTYSVTWSDVHFDVDPFVTGVWAITNNSGVTQTYTLSVNVPVFAMGSTLMYGTSAITILDANASGFASVATVGGDPLYFGTHDVTTDTLPLFPAVYSLDVNSPLGSNIANQTAGVFPGSIPGPAVIGFIGIRHHFSLTAGDQVTFNSAYSVTVPEPGTAALLGLGLTGLALRRRRN